MEKFTVRSYNRNFLNTWNRRMMSPVDTGLVDNVVVAILKQNRIGDSIHYEPRNLYDVEALYQMLEGYSPQNSPFIPLKDDRVRKGIDFAFKHFARPVGTKKLEAFDIHSQLSVLFRELDIKSDTSAGMTSFGKTKAEAFPVGVRKAQETLLRDRRPEPCIAGTRTQAGKKGRLVWMYPLSMTIIEAVIARPLIQQQLQDVADQPMAFGMTSTTLGSKIRKASNNSKYFTSMDSSQFDASVGQVMIRAAFSALRTWFNLEQVIYEDVNVGDIFDLVEDYFIYTPLIMPSETGPKLYSGKRHGVPSGSYFTQMVDSFVTASFIGTLDYTYKLGVVSNEFMVLGDDMLFFTDQEPNVSKWSKLLSELYGMKVNASESESGFSDEPIPFLGRTWEQGMPFRKWDDVTERAVSPERYRNYGDDLGKGAALVIASYGSTAFYRDKPTRFNPWTGLIGAKFTSEHSSGLNEYLLREGRIDSLMSKSLY